MINKKAMDALVNEMKLFERQSSYTSKKSDELYNEYIKTKNPQKSLDSMTYSHLSMLYDTQSVSLGLLYSILEKLNKVASIDDMKKLESELSKKVTDTLLPIEKGFKKLNDREKALGEMYR